jgi:transcription initiation factor TFIIB
MLDFCKHCGEQGLVIDQAEGSIVCRMCGEVEGMRIIDESSEWRNFAKESSSHGGDDPKRVGEANNNLLPDRGICTTISGVNDASLSRWNQRVMQGGQEKTLSRGFRSIEDLCNVLNIGDIVKEEAQHLFKKVDDQKTLKGRGHNAIVSSCVFIACRKKSNPRSIREISMALNVEKREILKCYSSIKKILPLVHSNKSASEYAKRFASELGFTEVENKKSQIIAERAIEKGLVTGKSPLSVASAAVYIVAKLANKTKTYTEISNVSSMKEITIKSCYKSISSSIDELLDEMPVGWSKDNLATD